MTANAERNQAAASPRRGRLVAQGIYLAVSAAFIVSATWQAQRQAFGPIPANRDTEANCSFAIGAFEEAVTNGLALAAQTRSSGKADQIFEDKVTTSLSAVEKRCGHGADVGAYVAALRLRDAAEATLDNQQTTLAPLRAAITARRNP